MDKKLRFNRIDTPKPAMPEPLPLKVFVVAEKPDGTEICRWPLVVELTNFGQVLHTPELDLMIELS
jgi:hypothetical protein